MSTGLALNQPLESAPRSGSPCINKQSLKVSFVTYGVRVSAREKEIWA